MRSEALVRFDAVLCDIDGCLGPETDAPFETEHLAQLSAYNRRVIRERIGPIVTLCSGRPQPFAESLCRVIGNDALPCIAEMGVWIYDPSGAFAGGRFIIDPAITPEHRRWVREAMAYIEETWLPRGVVVQPGKSASISLWHSDTEFLMSIRPLLAAEFALRGWGLRVSNSVAWINCDLAHVSKATGIRRWCAMTGLTKARLAGIGDTMGDLAIREEVDFFAVPSNAVAELKSHADYISPLPEIAGVLDILAHLNAMTRHLVT